MTAFTSTNWK
jgi:hypothetical protein